MSLIKIHKIATLDGEDKRDGKNSIATDANFKKGDKVRVWQQPVYGKYGEIVEVTNGSMEYTVNVEGKDYPRIDYRRIVKVSDAADDAEEIAHDSEIVALWQVLGDAKAYLREGKKNHNVKNVLAAAIKAAEKEDPNDRSVAEAKKVLAQFDSSELNNDAGDADEDNYYLTAKKSIEDAGRLLASAVISLSRSEAPNAKEVHAELTRMGDMFERIRKRI